MRPLWRKAAAGATRPPNGRPLAPLEQAFRFQRSLHGWPLAQARSVSLQPGPLAEVESRRPDPARQREQVAIRNGERVSRPGDERAVAELPLHPAQAALQ